MDGREQVSEIFDLQIGNIVTSLCPDCIEQLAHIIGQAEGTGSQKSAEKQTNKPTVADVGKYAPTVLDSIIAERLRQNEKWGKDSGNSMLGWVPIIGEEFGEWCETVNETAFPNPEHPDRSGYCNIYREIIHLAATAMACAEDVCKTIFSVGGWEEMSLLDSVPSLNFEVIIKHMKCFNPDKGADNIRGEK